MTGYLCACKKVIHADDRHEECPKGVIRVDNIPYDENEPVPDPDPPEDSMRFFACGRPPIYVISALWTVTHWDHVFIDIGIGGIQLSSEGARRLAEEICKSADKLDAEKAYQRAADARKKKANQ